MKKFNMKNKLIRITTVPMSLDKLIEGQMDILIEKGIGMKNHSIHPMKF
jgi:hypothetical protein